MTRTSLILYLSIPLGLVVPARAVSYTFQTVIDPADPNFTQLLGVNNSGVIAGYFGDGAAVFNNGFTLVPPNSYTPENFPGTATLTEQQTQVVGINGSGETVGFWIDSNGVTHGFTDVGGTFTNVDDPSTTTLTQLLGVNNSGEAAGYYTNAAGNFVPFTWTPMTGFILIPLPGLVSAQATDVNNAGEVVGFNMTSATSSYGWLDDAGVFTVLNFPGSTFTQALGLNNNGLIVGTYVDSSGNTDGFLYNVATGTYQSIDDPNGVGATTINGINDLDELVGFYATGATVMQNGTPVTVTDGFVASVATTPEPGSLALVGLGLLSLGVFELRRRR
jgi:hypothetical protein